MGKNETLDFSENIAASDLKIGRFRQLIDVSHVMRKPTFWFPTWSDTNQVVQLQNTARGLKFQI